MSLDVYLTRKVKSDIECSNCGHAEDKEFTVFESNITHNLGKMAQAAGIYQACWHPEELFDGGCLAGQLIPLLQEGLAKLKADPKHYEQFNASNGWGLYEHFVPFVEEYLEACKEYPDARVYASQ